MNSAYEGKIKEGAKPFLEPGEEVLAAFVARPRGWTRRMVSTPNIAVSQARRAYPPAEKAGFTLASPMALALTQRRLLSLEIGSPIGLGIGGRVKKLVAAAPLAEVDSIAVKRLPLGQVVTVTVRGFPIELEANALAGAGRLAEAFDRAAGRNGAH